MLADVDAVKAFVDSYKQDKTRVQYEALQMFLAGYVVEEIAESLNKSKVHLKQIKVWIYGDDKTMGLIEAMCQVFQRLNTYCPFCDSIQGQAQSNPYPLSGRVCNHQEVRWANQK